MNGYIKQIGASWGIYVEGELVAMRPDRDSAEECLMKIYLFGKEPLDNREPS